MRITKCRVCSGTDLKTAINLGMQPWGNNFLTADQVGKEEYYPLTVVHCQDCKTAQLDYTVPKEVMFGNHTYLSGITKSLSDHFRQLAITVTERFMKGKNNKSVLDIGSNDGTQLKHYKALGYDVLGVESSTGIAKIANDAGINTHCKYFNAEYASWLNMKFDVINASGVFFHLEELHSVTAGIKHCLKNDGVFVVQFMYLKSIVENMAFDQIYHEHLLYYTLRTINTLLSLYGLEMFDATLNPIHGGSIIGFIGHSGKNQITSQLNEMLAVEDLSDINSLSTLTEFAQRIEVMKSENLKYLIAAQVSGKKVWGMGAPVKGNTLLNYFGVDQKLIQKLVEKNKLRKGLYSPGSHIEVVIEDELEETPDIYYVLAWNFKKEILANNQELINKGVEFYFPVNL